MSVYGPPAGFYRNRPRVDVDGTFCTGCGACVRVCPGDDVLRVVAGAGGENRAIAVGSDRCRGCGRCVTGCPTHAINLYFV